MIIKIFLIPMMTMTCMCPIRTWLPQKHSVGPLEEYFYFTNLALSETDRKYEKHTIRLTEMGFFVACRLCDVAAAGGGGALPIVGHFLH